MLNMPSKHSSPKMQRKDATQNATYVERTRHSLAYELCCFRRPL
jgi:hypothetical protein